MSIYDLVGPAADGSFGRAIQTVSRWLLIVLILSSSLLHRNWFERAFTGYVEHTTKGLTHSVVDPMMKVIQEQVPTTTSSVPRPTL
jgi:hypothetical protein